MRLALKLVSAFMLGIIVLTGVYGYLAVQREIRMFEQETKADAQRLGDALEETVADVWGAAGQDGVLALIRRASQYEHTMRIRWVSFEAQPGNPHCPTTPPERLSEIVIQRHLTVLAPDADGTPFLHSYWPVSVDAKRKLGLEFSRPMTGLEQNKRDLIYRTLLLMTAMVLVAGAFAALLGIRLVGRPLSQLIEKTRRIGAGDLTGSVHLRTHDELAELAESLNRMCDQLASSQAKVRKETVARITAMEQLRHADRLKTVGRLASGMAHGLGTPLNVVSGRAGLIASGKLSDQQIAQSAEAIKVETDKMTTIIRQLLDFARRGTPQRAAVDLRRIVDQTLELLSPLAEKKQVTLAAVDHAEPAVAMVDANQVQQVLANLIVNAVQAMPDGGTVKIAVRHANARPPEGCEAAEGDYFCIDVRDEGEGIAPENLEHLFEPFFTTKGVGEGTGLGLSIAYGTVQEHGGWIDVASRPGSGSCFSVYLPQEPSE